MDTIPFHWDTLDAPQCLVMACLCPDECHEHLALPQVTLFHILIGNWFRSVSFQPTSIAAPPPEYTPPAAKVQALSFRLPYTRTGCQSIFFKRRLIRSFFRRMMHNKHEKIPYLNICLLFMQGLRQQKAVKPGNAC